MKPHPGRRSFLKGMTLGAAALTPLGAVSGCGPAQDLGEGMADEDDPFAPAAQAPLVSRCGGPAAERPNLLIIHTDQQARWTLGCYGGSIVGTPNIDWLAGQGVLLENFFTNGATCTPSRGCLMTGLYPHEHGAYRNNAPMKGRAEGVVTIAHSLADAGYRTGYVGKWHLADGAKERPGWRPRDSMGFADKAYMYDVGHYKEFIDQPNGAVPKVSHQIGNKKTYVTDWMTGKTLQFLRQNRSAPFFFMLAIPDPHDPFSVRAPYSNRYRPADMAVPRTFRPNGKDPTAAQVAALRQARAQYCGMVKCIDDNVGLILRALEELGLAQNTIVVFMTDHADYLGEHGRMGKDHYFEEALHIPCIVRFPGRLRCGARVSRMISMVDVAPTLLSLMGVQNGGAPRGRNASRLLLGQDDSGWSDDVHVHRYYQDKYPLNEFACLFTPEHELVVQKEDPPQLFRRADYPDRLQDLYEDPGHLSIRRALQARMLAHHRELNTPQLAWMKDRLA